jgi:hypothetical protein
MKLFTAVLLTASIVLPMHAQDTNKADSTPLTFSATVRERTNTTQWFAATPAAELYAHQDSLVHLTLAQRIRRFDYLLDLGQAAELALPSDAISPIAAQGQLGLGGSYYAANNGNQDPAAASFRQGFLRYHVTPHAAVRAGRFEFFEGREMPQKNPTLAWLQNNRLQQRLIGNFGFTDGQRSFDGAEAKLGGSNWDLTGMAGRATQGVFNMNANPELNVDIQYLGYTRLLSKQRVLVRGFGLGYHDGRTGVLKTDNRSVTARSLDHHNIRIGTFGGDVAAALPVHHETVDVMVWAARQFGSWGLLQQSSGAIAVEGGLKLDTVPTTPWLRGGYLRSSGDNNSADQTHGTFVAFLNTPRVYARFPFYNTMNSTDSFVQMIDNPTKKIEIRSDLHWLQLTAPNDFWYQGGGAFDNKVFGFVGRPANSHASFSSVYDISLDYAVTKQIAFTAYYAHAFGKSVVDAIYPTHHNATYGYFELNYSFQDVLHRNSHPL